MASGVLAAGLCACPSSPDVELIVMAMIWPLSWHLLISLASVLLKAWLHVPCTSLRLHRLPTEVCYILYLLVTSKATQDFSRRATHSVSTVVTVREQRFHLQLSLGYLCLQISGGTQVPCGAAAAADGVAAEVGTGGGLMGAGCAILAPMRPMGAHAGAYHLGHR